MINRTRILCFSTVSKGLLFLFLGGYFSASAFGAEPTTGPLAGTTQAHNLVRQNLNNGVAPVPGTNPQPAACPSLTNFTWDDALALSAQAWADTCTLNHDPDPFRDFGENLAQGTSGFGFANGPVATVAWAGEADAFDYANNQSNGVTGHYTQIAWASSTLLGCGFKTCAVPGGNDDWIVCRYKAVGNVNTGTTRPYCTATQTTGCEPGPGVCGGGGNQLLTVNTDGTGAGTVTSAPGGINCGADCTENYPDTTQVTLTAAAAGGSNFVAWGGDCFFAGTNATCQITMNAAKTVTATFDTVGGGNQTLTVNKNGTGTGTVTSNPAGVNCGVDCTENYPDNTQVTLTATADGGSNFVGWDGACLFAGANATCAITMDAVKNVTATFNAGGGNACAGAVNLVCGVPLNGTTVGATANFDGYACAGGGQAGTDVVHKLVSAQAGQVTLDLTPNVGDLDLFVLGGCDTNTCFGASENFQPTNVPEQVIFTAVAGQTYDVIVEDFNSVGDTYVLTATCPGGGCNAPDGQDANLDNTTENADRTVHVCGTITTGAAYEIGGGGGAAHVTMIAPTSIKFGDGLSVKANGGMTAKHN